MCIQVVFILSPSFSLINQKYTFNTTHLGTKLVDSTHFDDYTLHPRSALVNECVNSSFEVSHERISSLGVVPYIYRTIILNRRVWKRQRNKEIVFHQIPKKTCLFILKKVSYFLSSGDSSLYLKSISQESRGRMQETFDMI